MENPTVQIRPNANGADGFIIHVRDNSGEAFGSEHNNGSSSGVIISPGRILSRIRRMFLRFFFYFPSRGSPAMSSRQRQRHLEKFEPPKTSCSSHYSSYSHHNEAITDCIEFFNKSSSQEQQIVVEGGNSDAMV